MKYKFYKKKIYKVKLTLLDVIKQIIKNNETYNLNHTLQSV